MLALPPGGGGLALKTVTMASASALVGSSKPTIPPVAPAMPLLPPKDDEGGRSRPMVGSSRKLFAPQPSSVSGDSPVASECCMFNEWEVVKEAIESAILPSELQEIYSLSLEEVLHFFMELSNHLSDVRRARESSLYDATAAYRWADKMVEENKCLKEALETMASNYEKRLREATTRADDADIKAAEAKREAEDSMWRTEELVAESKCKVAEQLDETHRQAVETFRVSEDFVRKRASMVEEHKVSRELHKEKMAFSQDAYETGYKTSFSDCWDQVATQLLGVDLSFLDEGDKEEDVEGLLSQEVIIVEERSGNV
ncbi:hypothetical protein COCNU_04G001650 [Cocos nucifera]|uniref:Uncharacterized protein n=1 Tax=Cocos nucifera TaxID=13894 RepID=A0A8K0I5I7_COCNU|nr:hypothetical protein COCNU_04G001650 [Cocos nucifera]